MRLVALTGKYLATALPCLHDNCAKWIFAQDALLDVAGTLFVGCAMPQSPAGSHLNQPYPAPGAAVPADERADAENHDV